VNKTVLFYVLFACVALLWSCNTIDPAIKVPSYIHIDNINLTTTYANEGSNSAKITDAWLYVNDQFIGAFQTPATVPVLTEGNCKVTVGAGIKKNGIAASRADYDFYAQYSQTFALKRGEKLNISPTVKYLSTANFSWKEDFETVGVSFTYPDSTSEVIQKTINAADAFEGSGSGVVYLNNTGSFFQAASSLSFTLPNDGSAVYLELNYKTNNPFVVGFINSTSLTFVPVLTINPSTQWNKIYVELGPVIQAYPSSGSYNIFFAMDKDVSVSQAQLYLDNIKLVHF
jgi:hypothetical protein